MAGKVKDSSKKEVWDRVKKIKKRKEKCRDGDDISAEALQCKGARKKSRTSKAPQQKDACEGEGNITEELEYQAECCEDGVPELRMSKKKCKKRRQHEEEVSDETLTRKRKHDDNKADEETLDPVMKKGKKKKKNKSIELADCADVVEQGAFKNKKKTKEIEDQSGGDDASLEDPKRQETKKKKKRKKLGDSETTNDSHGLSDTHEDTGKDENTNGVKKAVVCKRKKRSKSESEGHNQKELDIMDQGDDVQSEANHADNAHHCSDENSDTVKRKKKKEKGQLQPNSDDCADNLEQRKKKNKRKTIERDDAARKADVKAQKSKKRKTKDTNTDVDVAGKDDKLLVAHEHQPKTRGKKKQSPVGALDGEAPCEPNERKIPRKAGSISPAASGSSNECRAGTRSKGTKRAKAGGRKKPNVPDNLAENKQMDGSQRDQGETGRSMLKNLKGWVVDSDVKLVAIKPGNVEEEKFDLARRVALQTQVDIMTGKVSLGTNKSRDDSGGDSGGGDGDGGVSSKARATQFGQWDTACLGDATKQNKFLRLMGGFKKSSGHSGSELESGPGTSGRANMALGGESENRLNSALESQFQHALQRKNYQQRGVGLGFQADASAKKTFFIDKAMSRSLKLE
ncbi:lysine-rich nucleolar protein 1 [Petromyzon marinus]|uniref:lysine-rich nucleolar protein 1 n=1 Tax=Petromyzon marinus TaxID=7757 RepID=UPI003F72BFD1